MQGTQAYKQETGAWVQGQTDIASVDKLDEFRDPVYGPKVTLTIGGVLCKVGDIMKRIS